MMFCENCYSYLFFLFFLKKQKIMVYFVPIFFKVKITLLEDFYCFFNLIFSYFLYF